MYEQYQSYSVNISDLFQKKNIKINEKNNIYNNTNNYEY